MLFACMSNVKVIFCVCTFSHTHTHALALAAAEPGSRETVIPSFLWSLAESSLLHACSLVEGGDQKTKCAEPASDEPG